MSVPTTVSDLERNDVRGQIFQADLCNDARTVRPRKKTNSAGDVGLAYFGESAMPLPVHIGRGGVSALPNFVGSPILN